MLCFLEMKFGSIEADVAVDINNAFGNFWILDADGVVCFEAVIEVMGFGSGRGRRSLHVMAYT